MKIICKQCGREFELTESEIAFFKGKGLSLPKRCPECRKLNKDKKSQTAANTSAESESAVSSGKSSGSKRFVIAAVIVAVIVLAFLYGSRFGDLSGGDSSGEYTAYTLPTAAYTEAESNSSVQETSAVTQSAVTSSAKPASAQTSAAVASSSYHFRNRTRLDEHYEKHGIEMGFSSAQEYEAAAAKVISDPGALTKYEAEDGDEVYFIESTGEIVFVAPGNIIRTYFIADKAYFDRQ